MFPIVASTSLVLSLAIAPHFCKMDRAALEAMGFDPSDVECALSAAFGSMEDAVEMLLALGEASFSASATSDATALEAMGFDSSEVATTLDIIGSGDVNFAVDRLLR